MEAITLQYELADAPFAEFYGTSTPMYLEQPFTDRVNPNFNPGQRFPYNAAVGGKGDWSQFLPFAGSQVWNHDSVVPYTEQFNFTVQRQIGPSSILTIGYVGSVGRHLLAQSDQSPGNAATCLKIAALMIAQGEGGSACGPGGEDSIYNVSPGITYYGTRPYSVTSGQYLSKGILDFGNLPNMVTWGVSAYNSFQASLQKSAGPVTFLAGYTYSKSQDNSSGFSDSMIDPFNHYKTYGLSSFNMPHNFTVSYSYNLPLQKLAPSSTGVRHGLLNGWQLSGITRFVAGFPVGLSDSGDNSLCGCGTTDVPNYNGQQIQYFNPRQSAHHQYFSTSQFSAEPIGTFGTSPLRFFNGPGLNNWDMALQKATKISERVSIQFRAEFFNAFNHAQFQGVVGNFAAGNFGSVTSARDPRIGQMALKLFF